MRKWVAYIHVLQHISGKGTLELYLALCKIGECMFWCLAHPRFILAVAQFEVISVERYWKSYDACDSFAIGLKLLKKKLPFFMDVFLLHLTAWAIDNWL